MADGDYERQSTVERQISIMVEAMARRLRAEMDPVKKQAAAAEQEIAQLKAEIADLKSRLGEATSD